MKQSNYLYLLSEDDNDDYFYKACLEKIHNCEYEILPTRLRKGGGLTEVRRALTPFLSIIKHTGSVESTFFLISVDNDRRPTHPKHAKRDDFHKLPPKEQRDRCRHCEIEEQIQAKLGQERSQWPIPGAIVIPVEMLESWLLLICDHQKYGNETQLPIFPDKTKASAQTYYGSPKKVPDQLKDLVEAERQALGQSKRDFYQHCASLLEPDLLAKLAPSFAQFLTQLQTWNCAQSSETSTST